MPGDHKANRLKYVTGSRYAKVFGFNAHNFQKQVLSYLHTYTFLAIYGSVYVALDNAQNAGTYANI